MGRVPRLRLLSALLLLTCVLATRQGRADDQREPWPARVASYTLHARLDVAFHRVQASGQITFTNLSAVPVTELWFHLYPNAFASTHTRFWKTSGATRRNRRPLQDGGQLDVLELSIQGSENTNLWSSAEPTTPGDPDDATDRRVPLTQPLPSGATIILNVSFVTQLPFIVERMGWVESFHAAAQWFPKLARLQADGTWRHFPYEALSEFSADFGDYDVTLDVPESFRVAAPGAATVLSRGNGRRSTRFVMRGVHDFAWFAWDRFERFSSVFGGIRVEMYAPPGHARNVRLELAELGFGLPMFQDLFGTYPYSQLVVVHPPDVASPAGGMEYPGLIVTGGPWYSPLIGSRAISAVTFHELAHQWFYGLVATDEALYPVLDEGLASWAELHALMTKYGAGSAYSGFGVEVSASAFAQLMGTGGYRPGPLATSATSFGTFSQLTHSVYARMTLLLQTIGNVYGQEKLRAALRHYSLQNRFSHPPPQALVSAFEVEIGRAAGMILETALFSDGWVDFEPVSVSSRIMAPGTWKSSISVRRSGTLKLPVDVAVAFDDGHVLNHTCEFDRSECSFELESQMPVASVTVDPHRKITIESRCANNTVWRTVPPRPPLLLERLIYALQLVLGGAFL
jgi:hypothetical protein